MQERESGSQSAEAISRSGAPSQPWQSGYWWRCRHLHVPVIVWIVASVLGGAAIGSALEPDGPGAEPPATVEVVSEPALAEACDELDADVDAPSYMAAPVEVVGDDGDVGDDVDELDADHDGIACD